MAPFSLEHAGANLAALGIGIAFGFVLERAGFGNARNLAAQFYLTDMRVLKVMFTAIVTAMVLVFLASAVGLLDFDRVWVPPTHLWPGILGGLLLGVGFIIGGYCPGTSLVSAATLKLDGLAFAGGVLAGTFAFGEVVPAFWGFFDSSGAYGRLTLPDLLGVDAGLVVLGVVAMAVGAFWLAEWTERKFAPAGSQSPVTPGLRLFRRTAIAAGLGLALVTLVIGQPSAARKIAWMEPQNRQRLDSREVFLDPAEVLGLMHNHQVPLALLDVRGQADYNLFHLVDAQRVTVGQLESDWVRRLPAKATVVVMSNDETGAVEAWKRLAVRNLNAYILAGGVNRWLDLYLDRRPAVPDAETPPEGSDRLRHQFAAALGSRQPASRPEMKAVPPRDFKTKARSLTTVRPVTGGCGG